MSTKAGPEVGSLDHYARLVRRLLAVPVGLASVVEVEVQLFPGASGLGEPWHTMRETPLSHSFCQYVVKDQQPLVVADARRDARLAGNLAIEDLDVIAYAGWPLTDHTGQAIGSLCAIDSTPREWTAEEVETLQDLAQACSAEIAARARAEETAAALLVAEALGDRSRALLALSTGLSSTQTIAEVADAVARVGTEQLGCERAGMWLRGSAEARIARRSSADRAVPEQLTYVATPSVRWQSAEAFSELPFDTGNPLGAALSGLEPIFYPGRVQQNQQFPHLANPEQLGEARAFVPLVAGPAAYGALALVWPVERSFSEEDRLTIEALASYTAQAVHRAQLFEERQAVSLTLQSAMLTSLPTPEHLDLAARYLPAQATEQVGGDWYDAVVAPGGTTHLMIGDVEGHNISAAATMGQLRSMMRMVAWGSVAPASQDLQRLDRAMRDLGVETTASALLARVEEPVDGSSRRTLHWSSAGHLPPLLVDPNGVARYLSDDVVGDLLLGVLPDVERRDLVVAVEAGSIVLLYTDGLVERRGEPLSRGLGRLRAAAARAAHLGADDFLDRVVSELAWSSPEDDVAVLAVRFER